ncbi:hypothetical protein LTR91_020222 [Friedmanniomyces endolithicus]|uniref:Uncharacterized protein n=1 Tax=Friedmanniomyces endolithicus TaxID=329885 RepID=A0AAN6HCU3_9PEZI|nr:hypothetical protein LTR75_016872 [Friedmanniomyces endolithicus]KAK0897683.1 hypothetical protein LTR02_010545 [Friedmanniomyces endolithicus]KAK0960674.1 hypothetical protein LTR91_020222 [Friedmanniomyces endolithicus]KAK1026300.1 hypothetical protein LTS16_022474 [Friedmanniomyces endolithicus]
MKQEREETAVVSRQTTGWLWFKGHLEISDADESEGKKHESVMHRGAAEPCITTVKNRRCMQFLRATLALTLPIEVFAIRRVSTAGRADAPLPFPKPYMYSTSSSTCRRVQLREILFGLGSTRAPQYRLLSASTLLHDETTAQAERRPRDTRPERNYVFRHIHPHGRIIGKPGRRQRQSSEQLATASLGKPSEVIVLRDVVEQPAKRRPIGVEENGVNSRAEKAIEAVAIASKLEEGLGSDEDEVNASIEKLRPENLVVDKQAWKELEKQLLEGYNLPQLVKYLSRASRVAHAETAAANVIGSSNKMHATSWYPGRTPMEHRLGRTMIEKREPAKSKAKVAKRILRSAWGVTTDTEASQLGEIELHANPWHLSLLFDVKRNGVTTFEAFIDSPLLSRTSEVRARKEDNVVRITARKGDAEEIAHRVQRKLAQVTRDELDLTAFAPLLKQSGWPSTLAELFSKENLDYITERTKSVFEILEGGRLAIHSVADHTLDSAHAGRLLLSLLDLPSPTTCFDIKIVDERRDIAPAITSQQSLAKVRRLVFPAMDLHRRHRSADWCRLAVPVTKSRERRDGSKIIKNSQTAQDAATCHKVTWLPWWQSMIKRTADALETSRPATRQAVSDYAGWAEDMQSAWTVRFGAVLRLEETSPSHAGSSRSAPLPNGRSPTKKSTLFHDQVTGLLPLLSNFMPIQMNALLTSNTLATGTVGQSTQTSPDRRLIVHLSPSPFTHGGVKALHTIPRIAMDWILPDATLSGLPMDSTPHLSGVVATWNRQELEVAVPAQTADLSFARGRSMSLNKDAWSSNGQISEVIRRVQESLQSKDGGLPATAHVDVDLPSTHQDSVDSEPVTDRPVPYYISQYEHVTSVDYVPLRDEARLARMDKEVRSLAQHWPDSMVLRCREVNAGAFGGRRTEVKLLRVSQDTIIKNEAAAVEKNDSTPESEVNRKPESAELQLVDTAMTLLRLMTRASYGELRSPYGTSTQNEAEDEMELTHKNLAK